VGFNAGGLGWPTADLSNRFKLRLGVQSNADLKNKLRAPFGGRLFVALERERAIVFKSLRQ
jgi:hypothetical protein